MNKALLFVVTSVLALAAAPSDAGGKKELVKTAIARLLERDVARDAATQAVPAAQARMVWRYAREAQAKREMRAGITAGSHFTANVKQGRPPNPLTAQRQYGLPQAPQVRMRVRIAEGQPVLTNKALGGKPGRGELVNTETLPPEAIQRITRLPR